MASSESQVVLFPDLPKDIRPVVSLKALERPVWTECKARLISRYMRYFVFITRHGTYIDGFAGPQRGDKPEAEQMWSARLVIQNEPRWIRNFLLCDLDPGQASALEELARTEHDFDAELRTRGTKVPKRIYRVRNGDFNTVVDDFLASGIIRPKEATFALLDQRSLECHWETVKKLAQHKQGEKKIEIFYFLATGWLSRTISAHKTPSAIDAWWGGHEWRDLEHAKGSRWASVMRERFIEELGYTFAMAWPITERERGKGRTMYYMIHATDHPEAPKLMYRAYNNVLEPAETGEQLELLSQAADTDHGASEISNERGMPPHS